MTEKQKKEQRIRDLTASLSSENSRFGDWAVIKCLEYKDQGKAMPYDLEDIYAQRQRVRDEINQLQAEIEAMPADVQ